MVKDLKTGMGYRADKLIEENVAKLLAKKGIKPDQKAKLEKIDNDAGTMGKEELDAVIRDLALKAPDTNNALSEATPFNLMFETQIGPSGYLRGFLRPETA
jgi:glycyl-tRNA synthetase